MRRLIWLSLLLSACGGKSLVDLTLQLGGKAVGQDAQIQTLQLNVDGESQPFSTTVNAAGKFQGGQSTLQYVPGASSGTITFSVAVLDANSGIVGSGKKAVDLKPGASVALTIILSRGDPGDPCQSGDECVSTFCVDGVCCSSVCDGVCESCAVADALGTCTAIPADTDPDNECAALLPPDAGGPVDSGVGDGPMDGGGASDGGLNPPDGGVSIDPTTCGGTCSGSRACKYPGASQSCGVPFCNTNAVTATFSCDGTGSCGAALTACSAYACNQGACNLTCASPSDCQDGSYCASNNNCLPKKNTSVGCGLGSECKTGFCVNGVCCESACDTFPGGVCNKAGQEGKCVCDTCPGGTCQLFYRDLDIDGYGDPNDSKVGCVGGTIQGYVTDNTDCDDDATFGHNVHPGQGGWFTSQTHGTFGGYDYNCDHQTEKRYPEVPGGTCGICEILINPFTRVTSCSHLTTTCNAGAQGKLSCNWTSGLCKIKPCITCCGCDDRSSAFNATVACGEPGTYLSCGTCATNTGGPPTGSSSLTQGCH